MASTESIQEPKSILPQRTPEQQKKVLAVCLVVIAIALVAVGLLLYFSPIQHQQLCSGKTSNNTYGYVPCNTISNSTVLGSVVYNSINGSN